MAFSHLAKSVTANNTSDPVTSNTIINGNCKLLVVSVIIEGNSVFGSDVTCDGVDMTLVNTVAATEGSSMQWYIQNNDINVGFGKIISVNNPNNDEMTIIVSQFDCGAGKDSAFDTSNTNTGTSNAPTVTPSFTASPSVQVDAMFHGYTSTNLMSNNRVLLYQGAANASLYGAQYYINAFGGSPALSWTIRQSDDWCTVVGSWKEVDETAVLTHDTVPYQSKIAAIDGVIKANIKAINTVATGN